MSHLLHEFVLNLVDGRPHELRFRLGIGRETLDGDLDFAVLLLPEPILESLGYIVLPLPNGHFGLYVEHLLMRFELGIFFLQLLL